MKGNRSAPLSDLPEFLHSSPYLPTFDPPADDYIPRQQHKPSIVEVLKSKPARVAIFVLISLAIFLHYRTEIHEYHAWTRISGPSCSLAKPSYPPSSWDSPDVDWSRFAYTQYATNLDYLCNSVMIFETLHRLGSKAERLLLYPSEYSAKDAISDTPERRLLLKSRREYGVKLVPIAVQHHESASYPGPNWSDSYTKLLAFNQTQYSRLLVLDSDSTILRSMDDLFFLPPATAVMPRAWWLDYPFLSSHIMLIQPSAFEFSRVENAIKEAHLGVYDMEIMNKLYGRECLVMPHKPYALLTGELRSADHSMWLRGESEAWNPEKTSQEANFVHFSDDPLSKPWLAEEKKIRFYEPDCVKLPAGDVDCRARDIWLELYRDFKERRQNICGI
ncbi:hypothetical protein PZA11_005771 [Diplocarpon coronariae]|uniref:AlphaN-acetylglucosamine transferase n=1 Tax=Diplocarpon coronariae TaxID=2795749 RepID=A0A218Z3Y2_9HELO|nr:alphaN-acetylglucosamine transferase [Marssonina coronariae]